MLVSQEHSVNGNKYYVSVSFYLADRTDSSAGNKQDLPERRQ